MLFRQNIVLCSFFSAGIVATARIPYVTAEPDVVYSFSQVVSNRGKNQSLQLYLTHRRLPQRIKKPDKNNESASRALRQSKMMNYLP